MNSILSKASRHFLWQHPWQLGLAIIGIALGVAVVIAIDLALESSLHSFTHTSKVFSGNSSHRIMAADAGLDESLYQKLRVEHGIQQLSPQLRGKVSLANDANSELLVYGIDPFVELSFDSLWQQQLSQDMQGEVLMRLLTESNTVLMTQQLAERLKLQLDDSFTVQSESGIQRLKFIGILHADSALAEQVLSNTLITDIASAQEILGWYGKLSTIDVLLEEDNPALLKKIKAVLPAQVLLTTPQNQLLAMQDMTRAFSINLKALGLLSLLVGMFLIYNTMTFLVLQRRALIGSLRCIGVTRKQIFTLIFIEATVLALLGTALGIMLGILLGQGLLQVVSATINSLFYQVDNSDLWVTAWQMAKACLLGIGATWLAVLAPALEATRLSPVAVLSRAQLETSTARLITVTAVIGAGSVCAGFALGWFSGNSVSFGLTGIFLMIFGFALFTPLVTVLLMQALEKLAGRYIGILGRLPARMVSAEISRSGVAIAALMVAVSATIGMDLMIGSFRQSVEQWVQTSLQGDLYVSLPGHKLAPSKAAQDKQLKADIARLAGVNKLSSVLHTQIVADEKFQRLSVFELNEMSRNGFIFKQGEADKIWPRFEQPDTLLITEAYAYFNQLGVGDSIQLQTETGKQAFEIIGVYADYSGDQGHLAMSRNNYLHYWNDQGYSGIGIYALPDAALDALQMHISALLTEQQQLRSNAEIFAASMLMFEQTFSITANLRWLAAAIAFVGVFSALMALQFERKQQLGVLRAIGVTPKQLTVLISSETGLMGLIAGLFAVPVGFIVAYELIYVIYQRAFGWTMTFYFHPAVIYQGVVLAFIAALLAGVLPALNMARTQPAEALRSE